MSPWRPGSPRVPQTSPDRPLLDGPDSGYLQGDFLDLLWRPPRLQGATAVSGNLFAREWTLRRGQEPIGSISFVFSPRLLHLTEHCLTGQILGTSRVTFYTYCGVPRDSRALQPRQVFYLRGDGRSGAASSSWEVLVSFSLLGSYT